jgi:hypothetical protein
MCRRRVLLFTALALFGCNGAVAPEAIDGASPDPDAGTCRARTCTSAGSQCGALDDGCGGSLECGACGTD